jgi:predicted nucleic acid-binding protein
MRLFLDTAPIIYFVEDTPVFGEAVERRLATKNTAIIGCELACMECLVKPLRDKNQNLIEDFEDFFAAGFTELVPVSRVVLTAAAALRARYPSLKTPDAIQLAAAMEASCDVFLTNDQWLDRITEIRVEILAAP